MSAALVKRLADAGLDALAIVAALEAFEAVEEERKAAKRAGNRERQARRRERETDVSRVTERDDALPSVTERDTPSPFLPSPPDPPSPPTPTREYKSPARKGRAEKPSDQDDHPDLETVWQAANQTSRDRSGRPQTSAAIRAALAAGATPAAIVASVSAHCRAGGEHAKGLHRIIAARLWRDHLGQPVRIGRPPDPALIAERARHFAKTGEWRPEWGDRPSVRPANDPSAQDAAA
jgi:hypothetical protein